MPDDARTESGPADSGRVMRVTITGTFDQVGDRDNLLAWLREEEWFARSENKKGLRVRFPRAPEADGSRGHGDAGPPMGPLADAVFQVVLTAGAQYLIDELVRSLKASVEAWKENRRVTSRVGEDPQAVVEPDDGGSEPGATGPGTDGE